MAKRKLSGGILSEKDKLNNAVLDVASIIANAGTKYTGAELAGNMIALESIDAIAFTTVDRTITSLKAELKASALVALLGDVSMETLDHALESAAYTILSGGDAALFYAQASRTVPGVSGLGAIVLPMDGSDGMGLESFDAVTVAKYLAATAVANAQSAVAGGFEETWFPQQLVPAGQNGVDIQITIPKVFTTTLHTGDGSTPFSLVKTSLIEAILTPSILESQATTVIPFASSNTEPANLVPHAQVPTTTQLIDGITVPTRPIRFGQEVDILVLSNAPGLIKIGVFDETDSLDPIMNLGTIYYSLAVTTPTGASGAPVTITSYLSADISSQLGTLLTAVQAGKGQAYQTTATASIALNSAMKVVNGATSAQLVSAFEGILGLAPATVFNIVANVKLSAQANTETGSFLANANNTAITHLYNAAGVEQALTPLSAAGVSIVITPLGYMPVVRRTNSNLRQNGTIIDSNTLITYRYPVNLQAPLISQAPIGATNNVTLEGLGFAAKIRNNGRAVNALEAAEIVLAGANGIPAQSAMAGAEFVIPTYVRNSIDVTDMVTTMNSMDSLINLRGQLTAALTNMVNKALVDSHYLAALEMTTGDIDAFEIIVVTDPSIAVHIWEAGDIRTFGDTRKYVITKSNNKFFLGKIYFSFRRAGRSDEIHPLDFGRMLVTPALTYDVAINRNGRTVQEIHTVPRVNSYVTLPILGRLDVTGLSSIYVSS